MAQPQSLQQANPPFQSQKQQPHNPLLHPPFYVVSGISPSLPISQQIEQIDQLNTLLLQEIDANFAKFHQVITTRVLPQIKRYAIAAEPVREGARFWRSFYEAAADIHVPLASDASLLASQPAPRHSHPADYDDDHDRDHYNHNDHSGDYIPNADESFMFPNGGIASSTPLPGRTGGAYGFDDPDGSFGDTDSLASPFDTVDRRLLQLDAGGGADGSGIGIGIGSGSGSEMATPSLPTGYSLPGLASESSIMSIPPRHLPARGGGGDDSSSATPKAARTGGGGATTFLKNGLVDMRTTPLNARFRPKMSLADLDDLDGNEDDDEVRMTMSPPVTMQFQLPPRVSAIMSTGRTPRAFTAAGTGAGTIGIGNGNGGGGRGESMTSLNGSRSAAAAENHASRIVDDLMDEMELEAEYVPSPRMPTPEGLRRYSVLPPMMGSSGAGAGVRGGPGSGSGAGGRNIFASEIAAQSGYAPAVARGQKGEGEGERGATQYRRSMANTSFGSEMQDVPDDHVYTNDETMDEDDVSFDSVAGGGVGGGGGGGGYQYDITTSSVDSEGESMVFGGGGGAGGAGVLGRGQGQGQGYGPGQAQGFNLLKQDEMVTFHGGRLEDAAGREVAETPTNAGRR